MIFPLYTYILTSMEGVENTQFISEGWMLAVFGGIISVLFFLLVANIRIGFADQKLQYTELKREMKEFTELYNDHEVRLQLLESKDNDIDKLVSKLMTKFGAMGGRFDRNDFK